MRTLLAMTGLWGGFTWRALRGWRTDRAGTRADAHVKLLLSGGVLVPAPRHSEEQLVGSEHS